MKNMNLNESKKKLATVGFVAFLAMSSLQRAAMALPIVDAYSVDTLSFTAQAGDVVSLGIIGDGDTDLDFCVETPIGTLLGCSESWLDSEEMTFVAPYTGTYYVSIENLGSVYNAYMVWIE